MKTLSPRIINLLGLGLGIILLIIAYYFQFIRGIEPCLLCYLQRFALILLAGILLIAVLHNPKKIGIKIYGVLTTLFALAGGLAAGRQIWLQIQPPQAAETCLPGFSYLAKTLPPSETLKLMIKGADSCGRIDWSWLGFSLAEWSFVFFLVFIAIGLIQLFRRA